jgi:hypothetical protein
VRSLFATGNAIALLIALSQNVPLFVKRHRIANLNRLRRIAVLVMLVRPLLRSAALATRPQPGRVFLPQMLFTSSASANVPRAKTKKTVLTYATV